MNENMYKENAAIFKALADETRLEIMGMLRCGEMCACKFSNHLILHNLRFIIIFSRFRHHFDFC